MVVWRGVSFTEDIGALVSGKMEFGRKEAGIFVMGFTGGLVSGWAGTTLTVGRDGTTGTLAATLECSDGRNTGVASDGCWTVAVGWNVLTWLRPENKGVPGAGGGGGGLTGNDGRKEIV